MMVTPFDPPYPKTQYCMRTSRVYVLWKQNYCRWKFYIAGIGIFVFDLFCSCDLDIDPMTFIYELDPYSLDTYRMCENELRRPTSRLSKVIILQTYRQTALKLYTTPLHGWSMKAFCVVVWPEFYCAIGPISVRVAPISIQVQHAHASDCSRTSTSAATSPRFVGCQKLILRRYKSAAFIGNNRVGTDVA